MEYYLQLIVNGLVVGGIYSLVALGFVIIYKATKVVNFAPRRIGYGRCVHLFRADGPVQHSVYLGFFSLRWPFPSCSVLPLNVWCSGRLSARNTSQSSWSPWA